MSAALELDTLSSDFVRTVDPLLRDSAAQLRVLIDQIKNRASELAALDRKKDREEKIAFAQQLLELERSGLNHLMPGIKRLVRQTSQQLEHGVLDDLSRVHLEARLAEVEGLLQTAQQAAALQVTI